MLVYGHNSGSLLVPETLRSNRSADATDMPSTLQEMLETRVIRDVVEPKGGRVLFFVRLRALELTSRLLARCIHASGALRHGQGDWHTGGEALDELKNETNSPIPTDIASRERVNALLRNVTAKYSQLAYFASLHSLFCDENETSVAACNRTIPGTSLNGIFPEQTHLTMGGSIYAWPHVCDTLTELGLLPS